MMSANPEEDQGWVPLIDVTGIPPLQLFADQDDTLARSVQRLIRSLDDPNGVISAFSSFAA